MALVIPDTERSRRHLLVIGTAKNKPGWEDISEGIHSEMKNAKDVFLNLLDFDPLTYRPIVDPTSDLGESVSRWSRGVPSTREDVAVVYYTGHGVDRGSGLHLITSNTPRDFPD